MSIPHRSYNNMYCRLRWWLAIILVLTSSSGLMAQRERVKLRPYADLKRYYLGFSLGAHTQDLRISNAGFIRPDGIPWYAEVTSWQPGFSVGVLGGMVIRPGWEVRLSPTLQFGDKIIEFGDGVGGHHERINHRATFLSVPIQLKYASKRLNNIRPYVAGGLYGALSMGAKREDLIRYRNLDFGFVLSVGVDLYMGFFKLSPELSFSQGLTNIVQTSRPEFDGDNRLYYTQAIRQGRTRMISLSLNFQ